MEDPEVRRQFTLARIAETFHVLPSQVARALDDDAEQLDIICLGLLGYASVKSQFDQAGTDDRSIEHLKDHPYMLQVRRNAFDIHLERVKSRKTAAESKSQKGRREKQAQEADAPETKRGPLKRERNHGR
jgi:hypothetical protein